MILFFLSFLVWLSSCWGRWLLYFKSIVAFICKSLSVFSCLFLVLPWIGLGLWNFLIILICFLNSLHSGLFCLPFGLQMIFFKIKFFKKFFQEHHQTIWTKTKTDILSIPIMVQIDCTDHQQMTKVADNKEDLIIRHRKKNNSSTCNCKNGKLKNLCIYLRPNPFLIDDSAYLTWAAPSGLKWQKKLTLFPPFRTQQLSSALSLSPAYILW